MSSRPALDPVTSQFLTQFKSGLKSVRDVSGELDSNKSLRARGGFSAVYVTHWTPPGAPPIEVCYKELYPPAGTTPNQIKLAEKTVKDLTREVKIWKDLNHPNIIEFFGYAIQGQGSSMKAALVSKWCEKGGITTYLRVHPDTDRIKLIEGMAKGLQYLHNRRPVVVHGDLKPGNVLISNQGLPQLCDFGLSRLVRDFSMGTQTTTMSTGLTIRYSPYEDIFGEKKTVKSDVYAFGCTCIDVLFNKRPFPELDNELRVLTVIENRQSPWKWNDVVPLEKILSTCCHPREEYRPSIDTILQKLQPSFNPSPSADAIAKVPVSFIRRPGPTGLGLVILGSIILGLSWIVWGLIMQSWPLTTTARVTMTAAHHTTTTAAIHDTPTFSPRFTTTQIVLPFTPYIWPIGMSLMAIGLITSWVVLGRVSTNAVHRVKRFIIVWVVVGPIMAAWVTASWAETSRTLLSCTRRFASVFIIFVVTPRTGRMPDLTRVIPWWTPTSRAGRVTQSCLVLGLYIWSEAILSWVLPEWIATTCAAMALIGMGWHDWDGKAVHLLKDTMTMWSFCGLVTAVWVTTSRILFDFTHDLWLIAATTWILLPFPPYNWPIGMSLMAISLITSWVVLGRVSTNSTHRLERFTIVWLVVGPIIAAWVTASWVETNRILWSCTRRSGPVLTFLALKVLNGDGFVVHELMDWMWKAPSLMSLVTLLVISSDMALSWMLPGWMGTSLAAISLIAIGWNPIKRPTVTWISIGLITVAWVTTSWVLSLIAMSWVETSSKSY